MLTTPGGNPTSRISSATRSVESGVISDGFITTQFPAARAGPIFPTGKHQREIPRTICPTTPSGFMKHVVQEPLLDGDDAALKFVRHAAEVAKGRRGAGNIERARVANRMSRV